MASEVTNVYIVSCPGFVKIGVADDVDARIAQLQTGNLHPLTVRAILEGVPRSTERRLHRALRRWRVHGEWFRFSREARKLVLLIEAGARPTTDAEIDLLLRFAPKKGIGLGGGRMSIEGARQETHLDLTTEGSLESDS